MLIVTMVFSTKMYKLWFVLSYKFHARVNKAYLKHLFLINIYFPDKKTGVGSGGKIRGRSEENGGFTSGPGAVCKFQQGENTQIK